MHDMNQIQNGRQNLNMVGNILSHNRKWQELELQLWNVTSGNYNSPPLQEDLDPRSRSERITDIRNRDDPRAPRWLLGRNGVTT